MITLTSPDGANIQIDPKRVLRARRAVYGEQLKEGARTRIDWALGMQLVREPIEQASLLIKAEMSEFVFLTSRDGSQIWFDARKASGPIPLFPYQQDGVVHSSLNVMKYRQFVVETPDAVRMLLSANGGDVLP